VTHIVADGRLKRMKPRKSFLLRISPALYESLEGLAQQEMRSVNGQIEFLLKEAVGKRGRLVDESDEREPSNEAGQSQGHAAEESP
jgi:hypothetical protein